MTSCGFKRLVSTSCGSSKYQKQAPESIILLKCDKDIKSHLKRLNTYDSELKNEATLILARAGKSYHMYYDINLYEQVLCCTNLAFETWNSFNQCFLQLFFAFNRSYTCVLWS